MDGGMISEKKRRALAAYAGGGGGFIYLTPANGTILTLAEMGIAANGVCTILIRTLLPSVGTGSEQNLVQIDAGNNTNRYALRNPGANAQLQVIRTTASTLTSSSAGGLTAGVSFAAGMSVAGSGVARASLNGAGAVGVTGGPTAGLSTFRIGGAGATPTGTASIVRVLPGIALSDADLQAAVAAFG